MQGILAGYDVNHATWFYLSFLLTVAVYFRFNRLWSIRNVDLALLLSIAPGILFLETAERDGDSALEFTGYTWLLTVTALLLVRLLCDPFFQRRPRLEQNLNTPGLAFLCAASLAFLTTSALRTPAVPDSVQQTVRDARTLVNGNEDTPDSTGTSDEKAAGPNTGAAASLLTATVTPLDFDTSMTARIASILSHLAVVVGLWLIGWLHFRDGNLGVAMATLYILLPATSYHVIQLNHVLPAALVVWAFVAVKRPTWAGVSLGLACGMQVFALFLLPLWFTWFGRRGALRFGLAWAGTVAVVVTTVVVTRKTEAMGEVLAHLIDWSYLLGDPGNAGFWRLQHAAYRVPAFVGFLVMLCLLTFWPLRKNLERLIACSGAVVVGTQFWYPEGGGLCVLWYLPLLLLLAFRPNLDKVTYGQIEESTGEDEELDDRPPVVPAPVDVGNRYVFH